MSNSFKPTDNKHAIWVKFIVKKGINQRVYLTAETPNVNYFEVYVGGVSMGKSGDEFIASEREIQDAYATVAFSNDSQMDTVFVKLRLDEDFIVPISLRTEQRYQSAYAKRQLAMGVYMGIMASILLYNFFLFLSIRNKLLLYYCFYVLLVGLTQAAIFGDISVLIYGSNRLLVLLDLFVFSALLGIAVAVFIINLLQLKGSSQFHFRTVHFFGTLYIVVLFLSISRIHLSGLFLSVLNFCSAFYLLLLGLWASQRSTIGKIYLAAWSTFLLGALVFILENSGFLPFSLWGQYTMVAGTALEAVLLSFALGYHFNRLIKENITKTELISAQEKQIKELDAKVINAELTHLRSQMNPHFLFNVLTSIQNFILKNDKMKAVKYISEYAKLVRDHLNQATSTHTSIFNEIATLDKYMRIEKLRYPKEFKYSFEVDSSIDQKLTFIPPLFLQPILENCVKHAFKDNMNPGVIIVQFRPLEEHNIVQVIVQDNGKGPMNKPSSGHRSKGMTIIQERLVRLSKLYQDDKIGMDALIIDPHGFIVTLNLPIL